MRKDQDIYKPDHGPDCPICSGPPSIRELVVGWVTVLLWLGFMVWVLLGML